MITTTEMKQAVRVHELKCWPAFSKKTVNAKTGSVVWEQTSSQLIGRNWQMKGQSEKTLKPVFKK
jgi:hypothetical protein